MYTSCGEQSQQDKALASRALQVQGLCDLLSANNHDADSQDYGRLSSRLMSLSYDIQEAKLIARLREEADPALIEEVECMLIEAASNPILGPCKHRHLENLLDHASLRREVYPCH